MGIDLKFHQDGVSMQGGLLRALSVHIAAWLAFVGSARGQEAGVLFQEQFDQVLPPHLPAGWVSSTRRVPGTNDFASTASSPSSPPNAILATNATVEQWLRSPPVIQEASAPATLRFQTRRSSTFGARVVVEASSDEGVSFDHLLGDAVHLSSASGFVLTELSVPPFPDGVQSVIFRWRIVPDSTGTSGTLRLDNVQLAVERPVVTAGTVVVNEIMYQPLSGEPEWVELLNNGSADVDLSGWTLQDASAGVGHTLAAARTVIRPQELVVLTGDTVRLRASRPGAAGTLMQCVSFPSLNNAGDLLVLRAHEGSVVDSLAYDALWGGGTGRSLERIDGLTPGGAASNWGACMDPSGATPGWLNSIARRRCDLRAGGVSVDPDMHDGGATLAVTIHNAGRVISTPFRVRVFDDRNRDGHGGDDELLVAQSVDTPIAPMGSLSLTLFWPLAEPGAHLLVEEVVWDADEQPLNNRRADSAFIPIPRSSLRITEIMFAPSGGTREYVEITNTATVAVELSGCTIADRPLASGSSNMWDVVETPRRLGPQEMFVLAGDTLLAIWPQTGTMPCAIVGRSGLGLNNDGDDVVLRGPDGGLIDSVSYTDRWHSPNIPSTEGRSLERINPLLPGNDPANWGTSVDPSGGTPGAVNSIAIPILPRHGTLSCSPSPFSPDGDGWEDYTIIRFELPMRTSLVRLKVFDIRARCVRELLNSAPAGPVGEFVWNGCDGAGARVRIGVYILLLEAIDDAGGRLIVCKAPVIVAGRL